MRILTRSAACPRFAPGLASPVPVRSVATITTHYGQFAALPGAKSRLVRRALRFAAAPIIGKNQSDICGGGAAKYYLIANSTFAREARPLPCFRASAGLGGRASRRTWRCDAARSFARCASGVRAGFRGPRATRGLRRALRMPHPKARRQLYDRSAALASTLPRMARGQERLIPTPDTTRPGCTSRALSFHHLRRRHFAVTTLPNWLSNGL